MLSSCRDCPGRRVWTKAAARGGTGRSLLCEAAIAALLDGGALVDLALDLVKVLQLRGEPSRVVELCFVKGRAERRRHLGHATRVDLAQLAHLRARGRLDRLARLHHFHEELGAQQITSFVLVEGTATELEQVLRPQVRPRDDRVCVRHGGGVTRSVGLVACTLVAKPVGVELAHHTLVRAVQLRRIERKRALNTEQSKEVRMPFGAQRARFKAEWLYDRAFYLPRMANSCVAANSSASPYKPVSFYLLHQAELMQ
mmetsp:Transcript_8267/g.18074  ORF Transcript_8267/g.18074 Transcript_8267/m.18074 type:complete len:256 (+) Transcript_8267:291-1058(+)